MRCRHRVNASLNCRGEVGDRSAPLAGVGNDSADGRKCVLDAMVKFSIQDFAGLLGSLALGNVDVHADQASCVTGLIILYELRASIQRIAPLGFTMRNSAWCSPRRSSDNC